MFIAIFMDDFVSRRRHLSAWIGIGASVICLWLFGASRFIVPTMGCILLALYIYYRKEEHP